MMPTIPPSLIVFEGIDGSGKTSVIRAIEDILMHVGVDCFFTSEKYTWLGKSIEGLMTDTDCDPRTKLHLFMAARHHHIEAVIKPAISNGKVILMDRYIASTIAYQAHGEGLSTAEVGRANHKVMWAANLTLWLDLPVADAIARLRARGDDGDPEFLERVAQGYQSIYGQTTDRWVRIKAWQSPEKVVEDCLNAIWDYAKSSKVDVSGWGRKDLDPGWKG